MAETALSYIITLVVVCNLVVMLGLVAIVVFLPRTTRRRPTHRADVAPARRRPVPVAGRIATAPSTRRAPAARAA
jgi:hypothetical protein